jgi:O-antigen/teichoic acid export membrane protein
VGAQGNRYGFGLYAPFALMLMTWGTDFIGLWIGPEYRDQAGPLLKYLVFGAWLAVAGQGASTGLMFGMGAHRWCAWGLIAEGVVVATSFFLFLDRGLLFMSWCVCAAMIANRCLFSAWALCRRLNIQLGPFLWSIYGKAGLIALPIYVLLYWLDSIFPVKNWWLILMAASIAGVGYYVPMFFWCVETSHQRAIVYWVRRVFERILPPKATLQT